MNTLSSIHKNTHASTIAVLRECSHLTNAERIRLLDLAKVSRWYFNQFKQLGA